MSFLKTTGVLCVLAIFIAPALATTSSVAPATATAADPLVWLEQEVAANDGKGYDNFGTVALAGDIAVVGAYGNANAAYVFSNTDGSWSQTAKVTAVDAGAGNNAKFGAAVAVSGDTAFVAAPGVTTNGNYAAGAVFVFNKDADGSWKFFQGLAASDGGQAHQFGEAIAVDGDIAVIGANQANGNSPYTSTGEAYVFTKSSATGKWTQTDELLPEATAQGADFGISVAVSGDTILVGADHAMVNGNFYQGAAYIFTRAAPSGSWIRAAQLVADDGALAAQFGSSVAIDGDTAIVGDSLKASAYVFTGSGSDWSQAQKLTVAGRAGGGFGKAVAIDGKRILVGAQTAAINGVINQGAAYEFTQAGDGTWQQARQFTASDGGKGEFYGQFLAMDGTTFLIGSHGHNGYIGAAYFYTGRDLDLAISVPKTVVKGYSYVDKAIATNSSSAATPAVTMTIAVPAAASFISATATQGSCSEDSAVVTCSLGQIEGNAGEASASVTLKPIGHAGDTLLHTASIAHATPALSTSAASNLISDKPPVAKDGTLTTPKNKAAKGKLEASDPDGDSLTFSIVSQPQHGKVKLNDASTGAYTYTPKAGYAGSDSFSFKANDGHLDSNTATVNITVSNTAPVAKDGTLATDENKAASGTLKASDPDGDALTFSIVKQPQHGKVTLDDASKGAYTYTPAKDYAGKDSFSFKANDGTADSNTAKVSITVKSTNKPPVASDGTLTTDAGKAASGTLKASDPDGDALTFSIVSQPKHGQVTLDNASTGAYTYTPDDGYSGSDGFSFKANDGQADSNTAKVSITVNAPAPPPPPPPPKKDSGGGAFGWLALVALLGLAGLGYRRRHA
jgi:MYXO-CTERM domain-containing protein